MIDTITDLMNEQLEYIKEFHYIQESKELGMDINLMWQAFYQQHKHIYGSYRFCSGEDYQTKMRERQDWIICQIEQAIESKNHYNNLYKKSIKVEL